MRPQNLLLTKVKKSTSKHNVYFTFDLLPPSKKIWPNNENFDTIIFHSHLCMQINKLNYFWNRLVYQVSTQYEMMLFFLCCGFQQFLYDQYRNLAVKLVKDSCRFVENRQQIRLSMSPESLVHSCGFANVRSK